METRYPETKSKPDFPALEAAVLASWDQQKTFARSLDASRGHPPYVFYDGPPFANGLPHYGHIMTGFVKDLVPRYQTMRGRFVDRVFGWDCHGLPAEMDVEKTLDLRTRKAILEYGIGNFNGACRAAVQRYTKEWEGFVHRQARWVDFARQYRTMDLPYMESILWAFKRLFDKGLIYEGYRVVPYCFRCETTLSNFETRLDNSTRPKQDPSFTVLFDLVEPVLGKPAKLLVWTTTPWTLPSNLALAVGPAVEYSVFEEKGTHFILAKAREEAYAKQLASLTRVGSIRAGDLEGKAYKPLFPFLAGTPKAFRVLSGAFVSTEDGTGIVHCAPGFGEVDQELCNQEGIPTVAPVNDLGCFEPVITDYAGQNVFEANKAIAKALKDQGRVVLHSTLEHNYPHCWRCDNPLIYRAVSSWYVKVTAFKDRMLEHNRKITWVPEHVKDGAFGKWLEGARDWCISRNRFWGSPIPVWRCDQKGCGQLEVFGSLAELEAAFGKRPTDLHRPMVDELQKPCGKCGRGTLRRIADVLDCWFESGAMPFAQLHYPFENKELFEKTFPADFIVEYIAQTRGWFYTLMVLATALFDAPPFKVCICHGIVLDVDGEKLSKRKKNYPDPQDVFRTQGADALRWFLLGNPILRGGNLTMDQEGKGIQEIARIGLIPIWNCFHFFTLFANAEKVHVTRSDWVKDPTDPLDRYILTKLRRFVEELTARADRYDIPACYELLAGFVERLSNWYIRRSRQRFYRAGTDADTRAAFATLHQVLVTFSQAIAPFLPMLAEHVYRALTGEESVHLAAWPDVSGVVLDAAVEARMDLAQEIVSLGRSIREVKKLRVRLPLQEAKVSCPDPTLLDAVEELILDELNVRKLTRARDPSELGRRTLSVHLKKIGPLFGGKTKDLVKAANEGRWKLLPDGRAEVGGEVLAADLFEHKVAGADGAAVAVGGEGRILVSLDTTVTPEQEREGLARDLIRAVQELRKELDLKVTDRIRLQVAGSDSLAAAVAAHRDRIQDETLCVELAMGTVPAGAKTLDLGGESAQVALAVRAA